MTQPVIDKFTPNTYISNTLSEARAIVNGTASPNHTISLQHPTRPHTPAHILQRQYTLFKANDSIDSVLPIRRSSDITVQQPTAVHTQPRSTSHKENIRQQFNVQRHSVNSTPIKATTPLTQHIDTVSAWSTEPNTDDWLHTDAIQRPSSRVHIQRPDSAKHAYVRPRSAKYGATQRHNTDAIKQSMAVQLENRYNEIEQHENTMHEQTHVTDSTAAQYAADNLTQDDAVAIESNDYNTQVNDTESDALNASIQNEMSNAVSLLDVNDDNNDEPKSDPTVDVQSPVSVSNTHQVSELQSPLSPPLQHHDLFTQLIHTIQTLNIDDSEQVAYIATNSLILLKQQFTELQSYEQLMLLQSLLSLPRHKEFKAVMTACCTKLLELSKDTTNDILLLQCIDTISTVLLHCNTQQSTNLLGTLYNITVDVNNVEQINLHKLMPNIHQLLRKASTIEPINIQLINTITTLLRNLTSYETENSQLLYEPCSNALYHLLQTQHNNGDILLNIMRVISKLSCYEWCQLSITQCTTAIHSLLTVLSTHHTKLALCVRVAYVLGDCTMYNDDVRIQVSECSITSTLTNLSVTGLYIILDLLQRTYERDRKLRSLPTDIPELDLKHQAMITDNNELLIKLIRLIANLSINRIIGPLIVDDIRSDVLIRCMVHHIVDDNEELILNTVSAIANLTYYVNKENDVTTILHNDSTLLMKPLLPLLFHHNTDLLSETLRCLGNLSRNEQIRKQLHDTRSDEAIILLLSHNDISIVHNSCGILLNISADELGQQLLILNDNDRCVQLIEIIDRICSMPAEQRDYSLCSIICKIILNSVNNDNQLSPDMQSLVNTHMHKLLGVLNHDSNLDDTVAELRSLCNIILKL